MRKFLDRAASIFLPIAVLVGCGGSTSTPSSQSDTATPGDANSTNSYTVVKENNCLSETPSSDGMIACRLLFALAADSGDEAACTRSGLSIPGASTIRSMQEKFPASPICESAQLPSSVWVDGSCDASPFAGWCYVPDPSNATCAGGVHLTAGGTPPLGAAALLACP